MDADQELDQFFDGRTIGFENWRLPGSNGWTWRFSGYDDWDEVADEDLGRLLTLLERHLQRRTDV